MGEFSLRVAFKWTTDDINLQSREISGQSKEIKQKWKGLKNFDICFFVIFSCHGQTFISGRETGCLALPPTDFEIFLLFSHVKFIILAIKARYIVSLYYFHDFTSLLQFSCNTIS